LEEILMALTPSTMAALGSAAPDFCLYDANGVSHQLDEFKEAKALVVMFICNHCPYVKHLGQALAEFGKKYHGRDVAVVAINSNDYSKQEYADDRPERMREVAAALGYTFPYLVDETQEVARQYTAACTPDFFLYDQQRKLVYRGQFDGSRPDSGIPITGQELSNAVDAVLADRPVNPDQRPSMGCNIKWKPGNEPPYFG
ncbi:MAG: thioredoxin family protein, partial [Planctomycetota bacterium]